ncbi:hypothetical protein [Streptomyces sp. NPDC048332]|uniref:hypothetical protein n=1 Tax=Streptomyces sp. NPDC048332 TaxID=3154619 RepID=UPI00341BFE38
MSTNPTEPYTPLHDPKMDALPYTPSLSYAIRRAREVLDERATANIHNHNEMLHAAVSLETSLRRLVTALAQEAGR